MMTKTTTSLGILLAFVALTGLAAAEPLALVTGDGGGQAEGQADGDYYVDASGALDAAKDEHAEAHEKATADVRSANQATEETKWQAWENTTVEKPKAPDCECDEVFDELEQKGTMQASHADKVEKAAELETDYVDAGADVGASGQVKAFFNDLFHGTSDLYDEVRGAIGFETNADQEAKSQVEQTLHAEDELRGEVVEELDREQELPDANPRVDGSFAAEHATELATDAAGQGHAEIP